MQVYSYVLESMTGILQIQLPENDPRSEGACHLHWKQGGSGCFRGDPGEGQTEESLVSNLQGVT